MKKKIFICLILGVMLTGCASESINTEISAQKSLETGKTAVSAANISEKENPLKTLTAEDVQMLASKHEELDIEDFSPYMDLSPLKKDGSLFEMLEFSYNGEAMCLRVSASDKDLAAAPYEDVLDHAVVFRSDFLELDTVEKEYNYDGSCADIRAGNLDHILNGIVALDDFLMLDLPDELSQSGFKHWLGSNGGVFFIKNGEAEDAGFANAGLFAEKPSVGGIEIWENGEIADKTELIKEIEPVQLGDVTLKRGIFPFFTLLHTQKTNISQ